VDISKYIKEVLISRDNVIVADFGAFEKSLNSAKIDPVTGEMHPPQVCVIFRSEIKTDSGVLQKYVAEKEKITVESAADQIKNLVTEWNNALGAGQTVSIEHLGNLTLDQSGQYTFDSKVQPSDFPESYGLPVIPLQEKTGTNIPPVKKEEEKKTVQQKPEQKKLQSQKGPVKTQKKPEVAVSTGSNKKLIVGLVIGIPLLALIVLGALNFDVVKQKFNSASNYVSSLFSNDKEGSDTIGNPVDTLSATDSIDLQTEAILGNYTIVNSETNVSIEPKLSQLSDVKKVYIIAGSFKVKSYATRLRNQLNKKGFSAEVLAENKGLFRVSVGSFDDIRTATADFERIKSIDENLSVWILVDK
jgi:cell division protein FtsN/nucleoid DNA-binding protein